MSRHGFQRIQSFLTKYIHQTPYLFALGFISTFSHRLYLHHKNGYRVTYPIDLMVLPPVTGFITALYPVTLPLVLYYAGVYPKGQRDDSRWEYASDRLVTKILGC